MKAILTILAIMSFTITFADNNCNKCNLEKVKIANEHIDSLTFEIVSDFIYTYDDSCKNNAEYSEWFNETLFKILDKSPDLFFSVIIKEQLDNRFLLEEVENPILDFDFQEIYNKLKLVPTSNNIKTKFLVAIKTAAKKNGQKIIE